MESILNFLLLAGFLFVVLLFVAYLYVRSHQAKDQRTENGEKNSKETSGPRD
ncbi:hypothetical protein [Puniceicoccus vermicola]|uniref:Uncharacterized protein n=1 Tax=Puniceicoccus vermicola TaxID=388746 RepID=A0A7X1AZ75_9BACT|nr:hypothetical protein [Puniceicoccus vermicola]MBC2602484.1 hypothetical protein [Puniceicoccus vermicola]